VHWWKWLGVAGLVGAAAVGAVAVQRSRGARHFVELPPDELRHRLRARLAASSGSSAAG
jgi:hypothetical protein